MSPSSRRLGLAGTSAVAAACLTLTGCGGGSSDDPSSGGATGTGAAAADPSGAAAPVSNGSSQVHIRMTSANGGTCSVDHSSAKAGPVTFTVTNESATAITEVELLSNMRIIGEKENLAPGLAPVKFTVTLQGGGYQIYCPGAKKDKQKFTVTGQTDQKTGGTTSQLLADGTKGYGKYVSGVLSDMVTAVKNLKTAVDSGDLDKAKAKYVLARPFYEKVESDVDGFMLPGTKPTDNSGNLDYLVDMRASNIDPKVGWHGFHAIERDLWKKGEITSGTKKQAKELLSNVTKLKDLSKGLTYRPEDLANGAAGLLEEVQSTKIKGEEEAYSHIDLVDFSANLEGAQQAFAFLKPGMQKIDPGLTKKITARFKAVRNKLDTYKDPSAPGGYQKWTPALRKKAAPGLSKSVQTLQDPLSRIAEKVATAQ